MKATDATLHKAAHPKTIQPMLATLVKEPFNDDDYVFEVKWDGYRIIALCAHGNVKLQSRAAKITRGNIRQL